MTARWIIGIDGSMGSRTALEWALAESDRVGSDVVLVHAYPLDRIGRARALVGAESGGLGTAAALAELDAATSDLVGCRSVERLVASGHAGRALVATAEGADLLVVGRHGAGGGWRHTMGSTSRYCVTHATVPTVVVPTDGVRRASGRIVVGFDGSDASEAAVRWAIEFAPHEADLRAVAALELAPWLTRELASERLGDALADEEQRIRDRRAAIDPDGRVRCEVVVGDARQTLTAATGDADLIVIGRRGNGASAPFGGSVSTWLLDAAAAPVVVVPGAPVDDTPTTPTHERSTRC